MAHPAIPRFRPLHSIFIRGTCSDLFSSFTYPVPPVRALLTAFHFEPRRLRAHLHATPETGGCGTVGLETANTASLVETCLVSACASCAVTPCSESPMRPASAAGPRTCMPNGRRRWLLGAHYPARASAATPSRGLSFRVPATADRVEDLHIIGRNGLDGHGFNVAPRALSLSSLRKTSGRSPN